MKSPVWIFKPDTNGRLQGDCYYLRDIICRNTRPVFPANLPNLSLEEARGFVSTVVKTKSDVWRYEDEIRLFASPIAALKEVFPSEHPNFERIFEDEGLTFLELEANNIFSIDFGYRCSDDNKQIILEEVKANYPHVNVRERNLHRCMRLN